MTARRKPIGTETCDWFKASGGTKIAWYHPRAGSIPAHSVIWRYIEARVGINPPPKHIIERRFAIGNAVDAVDDKWPANARKTTSA